MNTAVLPPMVEGGKWIDTGNQVTYVAHPEHIKRLLMEGAQVVEDPRPKLLAEGKLKPHPSEPEPSTNEQALRAEIDQLKAMIAQLANDKQQESKPKK